MSVRRRKRPRAGAVLLGLGLAVVLSALALENWNVVDGRMLPSALGPVLAPSPWHSPAACEQALAGRSPRAQTGGARIGTWNLRWFPDGRANLGAAEPPHTEVSWVACLIALLDVDALAVQEVKQHLAGRRALLSLLERLEEHTGAPWEAELDTCPDDGRQHVGFLWNTARATLRRVRTEPALNPAGSACAHRLRPAVVAEATLGARRVTLATLHLDSGVTARDFGNRRTSVTRLGELVASLAGQKDLVVAGDWNTMGCGRCDPAVEAETEIGELDRALSGFGLRRLAAQPGCSHYYRRRPGTLDHIAVSGDLARGARLATHGLCAEKACRALTGGAPLLDKVSDHCPLVVELTRGNSP